MTAMLLAMQNRTKELRLMRGLTLEKLAELVGTSAPHMYRLESGKVALTTTWIEKIAKALKISPIEIIADTLKNHISMTAPLVGYLGNNGMYYADAATGVWLEVEQVRALFPGDEDDYTPVDMLALRVVSPAMAPMYLPGDLLYFHKNRYENPDPFIGMECMIQLVNNGAFVRVLERGTEPGKWTLKSHDQKLEMKNVQIEWVAPIIGVRRYRKKQPQLPPRR